MTATAITENLTSTQRKVLDAIIANGGNDKGITVHHGSACSLKRKGILRHENVQVLDANGQWTGQWITWHLA